MWQMSSFTATDKDPLDMASRNFKADYLAGAPELAPFQQYSFLQPDYAQIISDRKAKPIDRETLVAELLRQNEPFREAAPTLDNIRALGEERTFTVTTGHQLVMMGGPLYTLYKIATAIRLATHIQEHHPEFKVVPVFWMASEDHDWEEIIHFRPDYFETRTYGGSFNGPVGRHGLEPRIWEDLGNIPAAFKTVFSPNHSLSEAFRRLILKLFGKYGLVVIDADSAALKATFLPWMAAELKGEGMGRAVIEASEALEAAGYQAQVYPRELNLFYMGEGGRDLLFRENGRIQDKEGLRSWSESEMLGRLAANPRDFSPNVAMRPLYQEHILPNLAYIGGWAEMAYWHQFKWAFDQAGIHFPLLQPRMSATLYTAADAARLSELGFEASELDRPLHDLFTAYIRRHKDDRDLELLFERILGDYDALAERVAAEEPTMRRNVLAQQAKTQRYMDKLRKKLDKVYRHKHPAPFHALEEIMGRIAPDGKRQERSLNFLAVDGGKPHELVDLILKNCKAEGYKEQWIQLP